MDQDFYEFFSNLFTGIEERKIIELILQNKSDEDILNIILESIKENKNV